MKVKAVTFNIRNNCAPDGENAWPLRRDFLCHVLCRIAGDIVGVQEAYRPQLDDMREALPEYGELGVGRDDGREEGEYCAILYRKDRFDVADSATFWFSEEPDTPGSIAWQAACPRICTWARFVDKETREEIVIYNLHLDHRSEQARRQSVSLLVERMTGHEGAPCLVMGDFNAGEGDSVLLYLQGLATLSSGGYQPAKLVTPLVDTFRKRHPRAVYVGTWHAFTGDTHRPKIDHILASPDLEIEDAEIVRARRRGRYPSDHFPLTADVSTHDG